MIQRFSTNFAVFSIFFDFFIIGINLYLTRFLRSVFNTLPFTNNVFQPPHIPIILYLLFPAVWVMLLILLSVYDGKKNLRIIDEFSNLTIASAMAMIMIAGILYFSYREISRFMIITFFISSFLTLLLWRILARLVYKIRIDEKNYKTRILIAGDGDFAIKVKEQFEDLGSATLEVIGFVTIQNKEQESYETLGSIEQIAATIKEHSINHILLALPPDDITTMRHIIESTEQLPVRISLIPDYFTLSTHSMVMKNLMGIPILEFRASSLSESQRLTKRIFDVFFTLCALVIGLPLMLIISLFILIFEGRPILFIQNRAGENGEIFKMYKFRTMSVGAENENEAHQQIDENGQIIYKVENDSRVTKTGRILRRLSLDELPQLFNVLRGTMSLVGPRPELPEIVKTYETWQRARLSVPQGMTGWWQVTGRSDTPLHLNIEKDIYYIENYSIWLDISIIIKTVWIILRGKGAY